MKIPFNRPYYTGKEVHHITQTVYTGHISGNGMYTGKCHDFFVKRYGFKKVLLTTSCTDALEMAALLCDIQAGDEVIMPSYTFVSSANAFVMHGARVVFADISAEYPNVNVDDLEKKITEKTKAILVVHYGGVACDMDAVLKLAEKHHLLVIEDAAHAIDSYYKGKPLGSLGHLGTFSFHETKNIISGEGGMLAINDESMIGRAEIIWEKGTNRAAFFRGETDKYSWVDIGSSFLPPEFIAAFLYAQLMEIEDIQKKRKHIAETYLHELQELADKAKIYIPPLPSYASQNGNMFFFLTAEEADRDKMLKHLKSKGIHAVFHYLPLHSSPYYSKHFKPESLPNTDHYSASIVRLPFFYELEDEDIKHITEQVKSFYK